MPHAIFSISDEASSWDDDDDVGLESFSETDIDSTSGADERESPSGSLTRRSSDAALDDAEIDTELISKDEAGDPLVSVSAPAHSRESSSSSVPVSVSTQGTPQHSHGASVSSGRGPSTPTTARPPNARALGSEFELLDECDWRGADLDDQRDNDGAGPVASESPVPKKRLPLMAADRPPASTIAFPSLTLPDGQASQCASLGAHRKPTPTQAARLRRKAGRRSISEATTRPLADEEGGGGHDDDDDEDDWHDQF